MLVKKCTRCLRDNHGEYKTCAKCRQYGSTYAKKNRNHKTETKKQWRNGNKQRVNEQRRKARKNERENLGDNYIKALIRDKHPEIETYEIPPGIIEAWRLNLLLKRKITEHNAKFDRRFKRLAFPTG